MAGENPPLSGLQLMVANMIKNAINNLPPEIKGNIDKMGQTVLAFKSQMDRIERNQLLIIHALNLDPEILAQLEKPKDSEHGETPRQ